MSADVPDWSIFDLLAERGVEVRGLLTCLSGIIAVCMERFGGMGMKKTFFPTLIHGLLLSPH